MTMLLLYNLAPVEEEWEICEQLEKNKVKDVPPNELFTNQGFKVGIGVQHLRVGDVEKAAVALPPLAEQKEIVRVANERLGAITRFENEIDHQLVKSEKNKQSILASAFSGGLH